MTDADSSATGGADAVKRSKRDKQAARAAESGVVGVKVTSGGKTGAKGSDAVEAKSSANVAVAAPMFAAQLALGMGGSSGWD